MAAAIYVAVLTPAGRGAVATIGVRGPGAANLVGPCFKAASGRPLSAAAAGKALFGRLALGEAAEEVVVGVLGPDNVEVHCHGGVAAAEAVAAALVAAGATRIAWEDWLREHAPDAFSAAALIALAQARSQRSAAILLDQYRGALRGELTAIEASLALGESAAAAQRTGALHPNSAVPGPQARERDHRTWEGSRTGCRTLVRLP